MHLAVLLPGSLTPALRPAIGAALGLVHQPFLGVELLLAHAESEMRAALAAGESFVRDVHSDLGPSSQYSGRSRCPLCKQRTFGASWIAGLVI